jgi:hypothetical protein
MEISSLTKNQNISPKELFKHFDYEYRCLAMAAYAWSKYGHDVAESDQSKALANMVIPEVGTMIQESLLLHVRNLIEFYSLNGKGADLNIKSFPSTIFKPGSDLDSYEQEIKNNAHLNNLKHQISVHVLHPTLWRVTKFRKTTNFDPAIEKLRFQRQRPNFNSLNKKLFKRMIGFLERFRDMTAEPRRTALNELICASKERFAIGSAYEWPTIKYH